MAWIKVEVHTPAKPEMDRIMALCHCSRAAAFLAFFKFYAWADSATEDGRIAYLTWSVADDRSGMRGFGKALADVRWVRFDAGGGTIVNFERHNGKSAKRRALTAERVARHKRELEDTAGQAVEKQKPAVEAA